MFIIAAVSPMVIGFESDAVKDDKSERDELLDNLTFYCYDANGFDSAKYEYYKEQMLEEHPDDYIDVIGEVVQPVKPVSTTSSGGPMDSPWSMKCHDLRHTAQSPYVADNSGIEKWRFRTSDCVEGSPIIGSDGVIYFGDFDRYLYALYPNGTLKWTYKTGGWIWSAPAIAEDGTIYITSYDSKLHALYSNNGTLKWSIGGGGSISSSPAIAEDGTIYFGAMGPGNKGRINAINPNGTKKWYYDAGYWIVSDPAVGDDGTVYIGSGDTYLYALYPDGTLRWRFKTGDWIQGHPSIGDDGTIYVPSFDGYLYALYQNGTFKWKTRIGPGGDSSASIAQDGTLFIGSDKLYAIYPNGTKKWSVDLGGNMFDSSPAISVDGTIYVGAGGSLVAVNPDGTERWRNQVGKCKSSPAIAEDGTIYVGSAQNDFGYLHAFGRGELKADAGGPYQGIINEEIQFNGLVLGGVPPYSCLWDFGDGNTSEELNPIHTYTNGGTFNITFFVTDSEGNSSSDNATATVGHHPPEVWFTKPEKALYIMNRKIRPFLFNLRRPLIIGPIDVEVVVTQEIIDIDRVEFYIGFSRKYVDEEEPFTWKWIKGSFSDHEFMIRAIAYNSEGSRRIASIDVIRIL